MKERIIFEQFEFARNLTLLVAKETTEENADVIFKGFPNSLRWQFGHIFTSVEEIVFKSSNETINSPEKYGELFNQGTRPSEWKTNPPAIEEIVRLLSEQLKRVKETFYGRLDEKLTEPLIAGPLTLETIGDLLSFAAFHESEHIGVIKSLLNALKGETQEPLMPKSK
ncbi:DinB family protein [Bacillus sp. NEB1478]|uniref:DinB family protein n=1 Tax=Bacillus sp. NEB1478 TaxID=3073816 RepID=UPI0028730C98|nr:DinB family protein [Bacillus sp. NEB1478]WNB92594.1 DinB family protein [Bacillus sp. NEB1478]